MLNRFLAGLPIVLLNVVVFRVANAGLNVLGLFPENWVVERLVEAPNDAWIDLIRWSGILILAIAVWLVIDVLGAKRGFRLHFDHKSAMPLMHSSPFIQVRAFIGADRKLIGLSRKDFFIQIENLSAKDTARNVRVTLEYVVGGIPIPQFFDLLTEDMEASADINPKRQKRFFLISKYHLGTLPTGNMGQASGEEIALSEQADLILPYRIARRSGLENIPLPNQAGEKFYCVVSGENWPPLYCAFSVTPTDGDACEIKPILITPHKVLYQPRLRYRIRKTRQFLSAPLRKWKTRNVARKTSKS